MKARVNTFALRTTAIESATLGVLGTVAHVLKSEGEFRGIVYQGVTQMASFGLKVSPDATNTQADIDLAKLAPRGRAGRDDFRYAIKPDGYLLLYVSEGAGGYHVVIEDLRGKAPKVVFDSRKLNRGDLFVVTLLRPGRYEVKGTGIQGNGYITVAFPKPGPKRYAPAEPVRVIASESGFDPASVEVGAAQGVVFDIAAEDVALVVDCVEPDDGPEPESGLKGRSRIRRKFVDKRSTRAR